MRQVLLSILKLQEAQVEFALGLEGHRNLLKEGQVEDLR